MQYVIKRKGHNEQYDSRKVYASVFAACMGASMTVGEAELVSDRLCKDVEEELKHHHSIEAHSLSKKIYHELKSIHPDAAYMYHKHGESKR